MAILSALSSLYYRTANLMMDMYSENTIWKAIPLMKTEDTLRKVNNLVEQNLSEKDFLERIEEIFVGLRAVENKPFCR